MASRSFSPTSPQQWSQDREAAWSQTSARLDHSSADRATANRTMEAINVSVDAAQRQVRQTLDQRIKEIKRMEEDLERTRDKVDTEMGRILASVEELEAHIAHLKAGPQPTAAENLQMREKRIGIDKVADLVEFALQKELAVIAECNDTLTEKLNLAKAELVALKASQRLLDNDLHNKSTANNLDTDTLTLRDQSPGLRHFPDTVKRSPGDAMDPSLWFQASAANIKSSLDQVASAQHLGAQIHTSLDTCFKNQKAQAGAVDAAFCQRIGEVDSARANDELQISRTRDEMTACNQTIAKLDAAIQAKVDPLKLATTRLSTRAGRPNQERTADAAHHSLVSEAETLDMAMQQLDKQLADAQADLVALTDTLAELLQDLDTKQNSLKIDRACAQLRSIHSDRRPRHTEYHTSRSPPEWKHFGRTRGMRL